MSVTLFSRQLADYLDVHLPEVRHCSKNTVKSYGHAFAAMYDYFDEVRNTQHTKIQYKDFTPKMLEDYTLWLLRERNYSASSVKSRFSALTSFLKYASRREMSALSAYNAVAGSEKTKLNHKPFPYFTLEEMGILLRLPDPRRNTGRRDLVLLSTFYETGARAQELCDLKIGDIKFGPTTKVKLLGKGSKTREIPISCDVADLLRHHIKTNELGGKRDAPLFLSQLGGKMTTACVRNIVAKYVAKARSKYRSLFSEPKYSPHSFRHSKAVHMVESGVQLIYIRNFLGHVSVQSTEIYARIGQTALAKMLTERGKPNAQRKSHAAESHKKYPDFIERACRK